MGSILARNAALEWQVRVQGHAAALPRFPPRPLLYVTRANAARILPAERHTLILAMTMGFGVTGIMMYMFTYENQKQYAVLKALGANSRTVLRMIMIQAAACALIGAGIGLGICGIAGEIVIAIGFPFRMMWFTPLVGIVGVLLVSVTAAAISARPVLRLQPGIVFAGR